MHPLALALFGATAFAEPCAPAMDLPALGSDMRSALLSGQYEAALDRGASIKQGGACLTAAVTPAELSVAFQLAGLAAHMLGEDRRAREFFTQAIVLAPEEPFDEVLARDLDIDTGAVTIYSSLREGVMSRGQGTIIFCEQALLDGVSSTSGDRVQVYLGEHLVQTAPEEGGTTGLWILVNRKGQEAWLGPDETCGPADETRPRWPLLVVGAGAAVGVGGGVLAYSSANTYRGFLPLSTCDDKNLCDAVEDSEQLASYYRSNRAGLILSGLGATVAVTGGALWLFIDQPNVTGGGLSAGWSVRW